MKTFVSSVLMFGSVALGLTIYYQYGRHLDRLEAFLFIAVPVILASAFLHWLIFKLIGNDKKN